MKIHIVEGNELTQSAAAKYMHTSVKRFTQEMFDFAQSVPNAQVIDLITPYTVSLAGAVALCGVVHREEYEKLKATVLEALVRTSDNMFANLEIALADSADGVPN